MTITMGNDEFILHIRKRHPTCSKRNEFLGRVIWRRLRSLDPGAEIVEQDVACYWGDTGQFIDAEKLPKTASQFAFNREILPQLYAFLDELGQGGA